MPHARKYCLCTGDKLPTESVSALAGRDVMVDVGEPGELWELAFTGRHLCDEIAMGDACD